MSIQNRQRFCEMIGQIMSRIENIIFEVDFSVDGLIKRLCCDSCSRLEIATFGGNTVHFVHGYAPAVCPSI